MLTIKSNTEIIILQACFIEVFVSCTGLFKMIVYVFFYLIEQHSKFL